MELSDQLASTGLVVALLAISLGLAATMWYHTRRGTHEYREHRRLSATRLGWITAAVAVVPFIFWIAGIWVA